MYELCTKFIIFAENSRDFQRVTMEKFRLLLLIAILSLFSSCNKVETERKGWGVHYNGTPIHISTLLPDLNGDNISSEGGVYSIVIPFPDLRYSYTPERIWLEPQDTTFTAPMEGFTPSSAFDAPVSVPFHSSNNLSFHGLHKGEDVETVAYGNVSGTLTLRIRYPESLPFDKIRLAANAQFKLPPFIRVSIETCPDVRMHADSGGSYISTTKEIEIPRDGYDFTFECVSLSAIDLTGQNLPPLSGGFTSQGTVILSPDDLTDSKNAEWEPSLIISLSTSTVEFTRVGVSMKTTPDDGSVSIYVPFPTLSEQELNSFLLAQVETHVTANDHAFYFSGVFSTKKGANTMETQQCYFPDHSVDFFFSQALGGVDYTSHFNLTEYTKVSLEGLNDLVKTAPDSIGYCLKMTSPLESYQPGHEYFYDISTKIYVPLLFAGTYWGKTIRTESITISDKDLKDAYPGTDVIITGWVMNRQPFELKAVPVILDSDGISHRFEEEAITVEGSRYFTDGPSGRKVFTIRWTAEETNRPISIYLEMTLGTGSYEIMAPDQDIVYGINTISKEVEIK